MTRRDLQHKETLLIETLLSALDARESARSAGAPMLIYLSELVVQRARDELATIRASMEPADDGDAAA